MNDGLAGWKLFYWVFFKETRLVRALAAVDSRLDLGVSPFRYRQDFASNPRLARHAVRAIVLSTGLAAVVAAIVTLAIGAIYAIGLGESFAWVRAIAYGVAGSVTLGAALCLGFGVAFGVAFGTAAGIVFGVVGGSVFGVSRAVVFGLTIATAFGVLRDRAWSLAIGLLYSVVVGVGNGWAIGGAIAVSWTAAALRVHLWLPQVVWMWGLNWLAPRSGTALRWLPTNFDEMTDLPLPGLEKILIETYPNAPAATQAQIARLRGDAIRQAAANRATVGIVVQRVRDSDRVRDLIAFAPDLQWIGDPPRAILDILPELREISRDLRAAAASTPYHRLDRLKVPIVKLHQIRASLDTLPDRVAARFAPGLDRWCRILDDTQIQWADDAKRTGEIPAVYIAGPSLDPARARSTFRGRDEIFQAIDRLARRDAPPALLLCGLPRTGKTSTLAHLPDRLGPNLVPLYVNARRFADTTTIADLARDFRQQIVEAAHRSRGLTLPYLDPAELEGEPTIALRRWFDEIGQQHRSQRILLCIDDFESLDDFIVSTQSHAPLHLLRDIIQRDDNWCVLFCGSHTLDELAPYWRDPPIETQAIRLGFLSEAAARALVVRPTPDFPRGLYRADAVAAIVRLTQGQPYLVQLLCGASIARLNDLRLGRGHYRDRADPDAVVTSDLVKAAIPQAIARGRDYFHEFWTLSIGLAERQVLTEILSGVEMPANRPIRKKLFYKEIVKMTGDGFKFRVPLIELYCRQAIELDRAPSR